MPSVAKVAGFIFRTIFLLSYAFLHMEQNVSQIHIKAVSFELVAMTCFCLKREAALYLPSQSCFGALQENGPQALAPYGSDVTTLQKSVG